MNNLIPNPRAYHRIKFFPLNNAKNIPETEREQILWCESEFNRLSNSETLVNHITHRNNKRGYTISVWSESDLCYLVQSIRIAPSIYADTIYISDNLEDLKSIAKFLKKNADTIMSDYSKQIHDAKRQLDMDRIGKPNGQA